LIILFPSCSLIDLDEIMEDAGVNTDKALNGEWVWDYSNSHFIVINNSRYERYATNTLMIDTLMQKGTCTTNGNNFYIFLTEVHGLWLSSYMNVMWGVSDISIYGITDLYKMYTKAYVESRINSFYVADLFKQHYRYAIAGTKLTLTYEDYSFETWTRR